MKKIVNKIGQSLRRVVLYLRLSKEDLDKLTPEQRSESIKNQELMLKKYAIEQGWEIIGIYDDEDFSGSDRDRPNFNKMLKECENGNIDIVLVKTQSRFARDMELVEKYVHGLFKDWGVRFVTYLCGIDNTIRETKKTSQITAMADQWMLEDSSENIRTTLRDKKETGLFTGSFAPYGYQKDPDDKNHLVIDPVAAEVVKKIFELYNSGYGYDKIISYLDENHIPSPYDYKKRLGFKMGHPSNKQKQMTSISKKGSFIITCTVENAEMDKITNVKSIGMISTNNELGSTIKDNISLSVRRIDEDVKLYYSTTVRENIDLKLINFETESEWKELTVDDEIPKNTVYIASYVNNIKRSTRINYELEITVSFSNRYEDMHFISLATCDDDGLVRSYARYEKKPGWSDSTIITILKNQYYIGNTIQGKYKNKSYKDRTTIRVPEEDWIIALHTHEPIIDKDLWYSVQNRIQSNARTDTITGTLNPLSKKVYCSFCGKAFEKNSNGDHTREYLVCKDKRKKWKNCDNRNSIRFDILEQKILSEINGFLTKFKNKDMLNNLNQEMIDKDMFKKQINALKKELSEIENQITEKDKYFQQLYEDRVNQIITSSQFYSLSQRYNLDLEELQVRQKNIKTELEMIYSKQAKLKDTDELFKKYEKVDKLTPEISNEWIDKIYIGTYNKEQNMRDIQIIWNF